MPNRPQSIVVILATTAVVLFAIHQYWPSRKSFDQVPDLVHSEARWTCPMHPQLLRSEKGNCPSCGMPLVQIEASHNSVESLKSNSSPASSLDQIVLDPADVARLAIATQAAEPRLLVSEFEVDGTVDPDEARLVAVPSRVAGRIEKMFVNVTGQNVNRGEPLYSIYSPSLVVSQEEYLLALNNRQRLQSSPYGQVRENAVQLVEAARKRLDLLGLTEGQVRLLEQTGHTQDEVTFQATMAGTVLQKHVVEGNYVEQGDPIYTLADLSKVWIVARVPEHEISWVARGQKVRITIVSLPGEILYGKVTFIDPVVDPETRTVKVRAEIANSQRKLKPGMFGRVKIRSSSLEPFLSIPSSAVIDASPLPLVYLDKGNGLFVARPVRVGQVTPEYIAILDGLEEGERVVVRGNFFIDSQRQLHRGSSVLWGNSKEIEAKEPTRPQAP